MKFSIEAGTSKKKREKNGYYPDVYGGTEQNTMGQITYFDE